MELPALYDKLTWLERKKAREEYISLQFGLCSYCGKPLNENPSEKIVNANINEMLFPENFFKYPIHLHHSHETGLTIGAIHNRCNAYLWQYHHE